MISELLAVAFGITVLTIIADGRVYPCCTSLMSVNGFVTMGRKAILRRRNTDLRWFVLSAATGSVGCYRLDY